MVNCACDADAPAPPELQLAWLCGDKHLPDSGGMMDQNYVLITRMTKQRNIFRVVTKFRSLQGEAVNTALTVNERLLLGELQKMGMKMGLVRG